jgi:hypothetical protein
VTLRVYAEKGEVNMAKEHSSDNHAKISTQPRLHQRAAEIQAYGTVNLLLRLS